ncbi:hypothetical protein F0562_035313 [Nyssa sinensis]|uniref:C2 domain-containing protein n=1 Tax=Nyssa sinensis TaxID=561372 RepID=A0A5J5ACI6_9ASTE|nr:hypothetical protein F0562_035313 [Nyssa sinensis]
MSILKPFQLLEINIISAQDLEPVSKNMRAYATAWVHPNRKLSTRVDKEGRNNPTWNDKFVFRVDEEFLLGDTSAVMIEIYALHWFRDTHVGTVRVLVGNLVPPPARPHHHHHHYHLGMRFVAVQVRRASGRPQGILNIGVALLDSSMRSMPLYTQLSASAVGYRDLMQDPPHYHHNNTTTTTTASATTTTTTTTTANNNNNPPTVKPILRRTKSERSERLTALTFDDLSTTNGSMVAVPQKKEGPGKASSMISGSSLDPSKGKVKKQKGQKASSVISGAEFRERPNAKAKKGKASSVISRVKAVPAKETTKAPIGKPISKYNGGSVVNGKFIYGGPTKANSIWSDSEVGPSPSEVAAAMAAERYPLDENRSSVLDGWSLDESVEGLRSKLERWRTELPPLYDRGFSSSSFRSTSQHLRRHTDGGGGLFSCFGNVYGYECQCICGKKPERRSLSGRVQSPAASVARSFL